MRQSVIKRIKFLRKFDRIEGGLVSIFIPLRQDMPQVVYESLVNFSNKIRENSGQCQLTKSSINFKDWSSKHKTLAIYSFEGFSEIIPLNVDVSPIVIVSKSFHVKPLLAGVDDKLTRRVLRDLDLWKQYNAQLGISSENIETSARINLKKSLQTLYYLIKERKCKRVITSLDDIVFGEFDEQVGVTKVRRQQVDHKDNDLLNELVDFALRKRIHVSVVSKKMMPANHLYLVN